jgi:hypothetical protein
VTSVTLDTNIYVSALEFGGIGTRLIGMARAGMIRIDASELILDELISVLRDDFHWEGVPAPFCQRTACALRKSRRAGEAGKCDRGGP